MLVAWRCAARRRRLRANTSAASRAAHRSFVCACARSTGGSARRLAASLFLQSGAVKPARPIRKNSAAASRPPSSFGSFASVCTFPPPMRGHAVCSGPSCRGCTCSAGKRRARAPGNHKGMTLLLLPAARPRRARRRNRPRILASARGASHRLQARAKRNATVRAANGAPRRSCIACRFTHRGLTFPPVPVARACVACGCA